MQPLFTLPWSKRLGETGLYWMELRCLCGVWTKKHLPVKIFSWLYWQLAHHGWKIKYWACWAVCSVQEEHDSLCLWWQLHNIMGAPVAFLAWHVHLSSMEVAHFQQWVLPVWVSRAADQSATSYRILLCGNGCQQKKKKSAWPQGELKPGSQLWENCACRSRDQMKWRCFVEAVW